MATAPLTIVLSGATDGIGREAARQLARQGHRLVQLGRNPDKLAAVADEVRDHAGSVETFVADNADLDAVRRAAGAIHDSYERIDVVCANAGTVYDRRRMTGDGIEATFQVNHLAGFLLLETLRDRLGDGSRVVITSSVAHVRATIDWDDIGFESGGWSTMKAYSRSKLANALHARHLATLLAEQGVTVLAFHPGTIGSRIWSHSPWYARPVLAVARRFMSSPQEGGEVLTWLATAPEVSAGDEVYYDRRTPRHGSRTAQDSQLAARLYEESRRMVGLG